MFGKLREKISAFLKKKAPEEKPKILAKAKKVKQKKEKKKSTKKPEALHSSKTKLSTTSQKETAPETQDQEAIQEELKELEVPVPSELETPKPTEAPPTSETKPSTTEEKPSFFSKLKKKITTSALKQEDFDKFFEEDFQITLLENNVALEVVDKIKSRLQQDLVGIPIKKQEIESTILNSLKEAILSVLIEPPDLIKAIKESSELEPYIILFFGINGSGKTTSVAKLAHFLKTKKISSVLAAADTFRAASIEQLEKHAKALSTPIIKQEYGSDPAAVAFDAIQYAKKHKIPVVLVDTAGRMYTKTNLIKEMDKIVRVSKPNLKIFVGESITGNDVITQTKTFNESIGIDGIILSKADIDEKAGTILSVSHITNKPIYFLGTGQDYKDFTPFTKKIVLKNLGLE